MAYDLQLKQEWCQAKAAWEDLKAKLPAATDQKTTQDRIEAERNIKLLQSLCPPLGGPPVPEPKEPVPVPKPPGPELPKPIPGTDLLKFYPQGRTDRSLALFQISGKGTNKDWWLKGEANFNYVCRVVAETKVIENDSQRGKLVFEQTFKEVSQTRTVSKRDVQLDLPDSPILATVWKEFEDITLTPIPVYHVVRKLTEIAVLADPNLKRTLTWMAEKLKLDSGDDLEIVTQLDKLSGLKLRLEYISGIGVVEVRRLDGVALQRDDLIRAAQASSLLMDYFVFPTPEKRVGEEWDVRAQDVGSLVGAFALGSKLSGKITLKRAADRGAAADAVLKVVRGEVQMEGSRDNQEDRTTSRIESGQIDFSQKLKMVRSARLKFEGNTTFRSKDHLLFGTEKIRDVKVEGYYETNRVESKSK